MAEIAFDALDEQVQKPADGTWVLVVNPTTLIGYKIKIENFLKAQGYNGYLFNNSADDGALALVENGLITQVALSLESLETPDEQILETPDGQTLETFVRNEI